MDGEALQLLVRSVKSRRSIDPLAAATLILTDLVGGLTQTPDITDYNAVRSVLARALTQAVPYASKPIQRPAGQPLACGPRAMAQFERAAALLQMLVGQGVQLTTTDPNGVLAMLATALCREGPHERGGDSATAEATLLALETQKLVTVPVSRRKKVLAVLGNAIGLRCKLH